MLPQPVIIVDYDPQWPEVFLALRFRLAAALGDCALAIEHVGSTAVPGLAAKPIIDINVVVADQTAVGQAITALARIGYEHQGDLGIAGREAFKRAADGPAHHLYVCQAANNELRRQLAFRDYLRSHPDAASEYGELKKLLAVRYGSDRVGYTDAKGAFVARILTLAGAAQDNAGV